jgi:uncharacterized membrane protein YeaQ/YmgE (transglycosylase-associated protein family)
MGTTARAEGLGRCRVRPPAPGGHPADKTRVRVARTVLMVAAGFLCLVAGESPGLAEPAASAPGSLWEELVRWSLLTGEGLRRNPESWAAISRLLVGGTSGILAYLLTPRLRLGGIFGCILLGIVGSALAGYLGERLGIAMPGGISPLAIVVGFVTCLILLASAKVAQYV